MIDQGALVCIGYIKRQHGFKGDLQIKLNRKIALHQGDFVFLTRDAQFIPYPITKIQGSEEEPLVQLKFVVGYDEAKELIGSEVYLDTQDSVQETELELVGYALIDDQLGNIGKVKDVLQYPKQMMLELDYNGKSCLIPLNETWMYAISAELAEIYCNLPEGILEL